MLPRAEGIGSAEARIRTSIGRAYYSLYLEVCAFLAAQAKPAGSLHGNAPILLYELRRDKGDEDFERLAISLTSLYEGRQEADYKFPASARFAEAFKSRDYADTQLSMCRKAHQILERLIQKYS